jgi:arsenical pump membrane protein
MVPAAATLCEVVAGVAPGALVAHALGLIAPLALFLVSVLWLARLAEDAGLAWRAAAWLARLGRGRRLPAYLLVCGLCAGLTASISLDGAVILMVPVIANLARDRPGFRRPLLFGSIAVANAFSLGLPQGNPTNILIISRLDVSPGAFIGQLALPALIAGLVCVGLVAAAERSRLRGRLETPVHGRTPLTRDEWVAALTYGLAATASVVAPWLGLAPWWALGAVATLALGGLRVACQPAPRLIVPWRLLVQLYALTVVTGFFAVPLIFGRQTPVSAGLLVAMALGVGLLANLLNNLPASVLLGGAIGGMSAPVAYAALSGLTVGALGTPHGSVATMLALERAAADDTRGHLRLFVPIAVLATAVAAVCVAWLG